MTLRKGRYEDSANGDAAGPEMDGVPGGGVDASYIGPRAKRLCRVAVGFVFRSFKERRVRRRHPWIEDSAIP